MILMRRCLPVILMLILCSAARAQQPIAYGQPQTIETLTLENGMRFILAPTDRWPGQLAAGWVALGGSGSDPQAHPGLTQMIEATLFAPKMSSLPEAPEAGQARLNPIRNAWRQYHEMYDLVFWHVQYPRWRRGEVHDPWHVRNPTIEMQDLAAQMQRFDMTNRRVLASGGYGGYHADIDGAIVHHGTTQDFSLAYVTIPTAQLERWARQEVERLNGGPLNDFEERYQVVHTARVKRDSGSVFAALEAFERDYWSSGPYDTPIVGSTRDYVLYTPELARAQFGRQFQPRNLVGIVVGDFQPEATAAFLKARFETLHNVEESPAQIVATIPSGRRALQYQWQANDQIEVRHPTVGYSHNDRVGLEVLALVIRERARQAVEPADGPLVATWEVGHDALAHGGSMVFTAEAADGVDSGALHRAWTSVIGGLGEQPITEQELEAARRRAELEARWVATGPATVLCEIASAEGRGGWAIRAAQLQAVGEINVDDLTRLATQYLVPGSEVVAWFRRPVIVAPDAPELASLTEEQRAQIAVMLGRLLPGTDADNLRAIQAQMETVLPTVQGTDAQILQYVIRRLGERIAEIEAGGG